MTKSLTKNIALLWVALASLGGFVLTAGQSALAREDADEAAAPIADEGMAPTGGDSVAPLEPPTVADIDVLSEAVGTLSAQGQIAEAIVAAEQLAGLVEDRDGADLTLVEPLMTIADLQAQLPNLAAAERVLKRLIVLIEQKDSVFSPLLVEPLVSLARIYSGSSRREQAVTVLRRARHITHRNWGILNMEQIELSEELADNYYNLGQISDASRENRFAFRVNESEFGSDSAELVPALKKLAAWYERVDDFTVARRLYKRSIELVEKDHGPDDLRLVDLLQRIADTYREQNLYRGDGKNALVRAITIHEQHPEADVLDRARSLANLGDWLMVTSQRGKAMDVYRQAWNLLTADGASPEKADIIFGRPKRLRYSPPLPDPSLMIGKAEIYVDVEFAVTEDGTVTKLSVADASAHWRIQNDVRVAMRHARFRPRFADGEPVRASMRYRWTYRIPEYERRGDPPEPDEKQMAENE